MVFRRANVIWLDRIVVSDVTSARMRCDSVAMTAAGRSVVILFHHFYSCSLHPIASYWCSGKLVSLVLGLDATWSLLHVNWEASQLYEPYKIYRGKNLQITKSTCRLQTLMKIYAEGNCSALKKPLVRLPRSLQSLSLREVRTTGAGALTHRYCSGLCFGEQLPLLNCNWFFY